MKAQDKFCTKCAPDECSNTIAHKVFHIPKRRKPSGVYPITLAYGKDSFFEATGEYRPPVKGEYYLSGAILEAYLSPAPLDYPYWIARPIRMIMCPTCQGKGKVKENGKD